MARKKGGPQPLPPQLHILQGTFREDRHGSKDAVLSENVFDRVPPPPPNRGDVFNKWWNLYCKEMVGVGVLTSRDLPAVEMLCDAHDEMEQAQIALREARENDALYVVTAQGAYVKHPAIGQVASLRTAIERYQDKLGFTPVARMRVPPKLPDGKQGKVQTMNRKGG